MRPDSEVTDSKCVSQRSTVVPEELLRCVRSNSGTRSCRMHVFESSAADDGPSRCPPLLFVLGSCDPRKRITSASSMRPRSAKFGVALPFLLVDNELCELSVPKCTTEKKDDDDSDKITDIIQESLACC